MKLLIWSGLYSFIANLAIGLFVYSRNPKRPVNIFFGLFSLTVSGWSFGSFLENIIPDKNLALFVLRCNYLFGVWLPLLYIHFVYAFTGITSDINRIKLKIGYFLSALLSPIVFTPWFIEKLHTIKGTEYYISYPGPLYYIFFAFFGISMCEVLFHTLSRLKKSVGRTRTQFIYITIANAIAILAGFEYFSRVFGYFKSPPLDDYILVVYLLVLAYAIVRHQLMDIEVILRKTLVFAGLLAFVFGVFSFGLFIAQEILAIYFGFKWEVALGISIFLIVLGYEPMRTFFINVTDRYLFQKKYDYQKLLKEASRGMAQIESLDYLLSLVTHFITMKMRLQNAAVLIRDSKNDVFHLERCRGYSPPVDRDRPILMKNPLIQYLNQEKEAIEIEQIRECIKNGGKKNKPGTPFFKYDYREIHAEMEKLRAACCIPSFLGLELKSVLLLGKKKSGDSYTQEDLNVLFTLAQESAIAIENARLYDEAVNRSRELQKMNEKLQVTQASLIVAEKNATMVGMAKAIGHEVNNPLSVTMLSIGRVRSTFLTKIRQVVEKNLSVLPEDDTKDLKKWLLEAEEVSLKADRSAQRISAVIHTLTDILKGSKGEMGPLSLIVLCREALEATRFSTYEENLAGCKIVEDITANILVMGNLEQLLQVFVNLIKNSYEAMEKQKDRCITISGKIDPQDSQMARIEISDNGPGIPPEVLPKIWMQGFSTKTRKDNSLGAAGQGQGLFVCKHIIESIHKGMITVENEAGKGTKFIIQLPLAEVGIDV